MGSCPDQAGMVGRWLSLAVAGLLPLLLTAQRECTMFKKEYCNMQLDKILMLDTNMVAADECQTACFERTNCTQFTYFEGSKSRCVLFNSCSDPVSSCKNCVSGPAYPRVAPCMGELQVQSLTKARPVPRISALAQGAERLAGAGGTASSEAT